MHLPTGTGSNSCCVTKPSFLHPNRKRTDLTQTHGAIGILIDPDFYSAGEISSFSSGGAASSPDLIRCSVGINFRCVSEKASERPTAYATHVFHPNATQGPLSVGPHRRNDRKRPTFDFTLRDPWTERTFVRLLAAHTCWNGAMTGAGRYGIHRA